MSTVRITIDDAPLDVDSEATILDACRIAEIYVPTLCSHPDLSPAKGAKSSSSVFWGGKEIKGSADKEYEGCKLCLVEVEGQDEPVTSCNTKVVEGMVIKTDSPNVKDLRQKNLMPILANHPHACLICAQKEGCSREPCSPNIPVAERCCPLLGNCELEKVADYIGIRDDTPRYVPKNHPIIKDEPMFQRDYNLCIGCTRCVRACKDLRGVDALSFTHDGNDFIVGTRSPTLNESECKYCGACVEVCPTGALTDKDLTEKTEATLVPCKGACPVGKDIPRIMRLISEGNYQDAVNVMREKAPLLYSLGNICFHPCEEVCNRSKVNEPIAICALERFAVANSGGLLTGGETKESKDKKVAIVGSGPAGLACAYYLSNLGYPVTIFEEMPELGGMLRYGVPDFRLPKELLQKDVELVSTSGFDVKPNRKIGGDPTISSINNEFDAVFLAVGAQLSKKLEIEGLDLEGVLWGMDFLRDVKLGRDVGVKEKVIVIGGGNVAIDVALTALRLGAKDVQLACLESREEMPAFEHEIEEAEEEGIGIHTSWGPKKVLGENGKITGIELMRCTSVFDEDGKFNPKYNPDEIKSMNADVIIFAIGQSSDLDLLKDAGIDAPQGLIPVDNNTLETSVKGIFAGGEIVSGPASVVDSVELGRKAASSIDKHFGGDGNIDESFIDEETPNPWLGRDEGFAGLERSQMPKLPLEERVKGFGEIELGFDEEAAKKEAARCLRCDLRMRITPVTLPPEKWLAFTEENLKDVPQAEGVFHLLDEDKKAIFIAGREDIKAGLEEQLKTNEKAKYFAYEEDKMFTKRESELLQQHLQKHGKLPEMNDELDDLF